MEIILAEHAIFEATRRNIEEALIRSIVLNPQQKLPSKKGRVIVQGVYTGRVALNKGDIRSRD